MRNPAEVVSGYIKFVREAWMEMKRVSYPSRKDTLSTSMVAIITIFITALFLGIVDFIISKLVKFIF
jgi:preprotein translocase subunit SecE